MTAYGDFSIERKLQVIMLLTAGAALALASAGFVIYDIFASRQALVHDLSAFAQIIGSNSTADTTYLDLLATELTLTDAQKTSIQQILTQLETDITAAHDQAETDFRALLTADQLATLDALQAGSGTTSAQ